MSEPVPFERKQRLRLRPSGHERDVAIEVVEVRPNALWSKLAEPTLWLEDHHLESGVDLAFWRQGARHVARAVQVLAFDLDRGRLHLARPLTTDVVQRRRTFRELVEVPVRLVPVDLAPETVDLSGHKLTTQDIGGGGVCLTSPADVTLGVDAEVKLELDLPDRRIRARGRVRWSAKGQDGTTKVGVAFTRISEREQDFVYGFLFDLQRNRVRAS